MKEMIWSTINVDNSSVDDNLYCRLIGILSHKDGLYGAGGLTSQHILHVGAFLGVLPKKLLSIATISPSTNTFQHLVENYQYTYENAGEESRRLLSALSMSLKMPKPDAENLVCKWVSDATEKNNHYVDSIYPGQFIFYYQEQTDDIKRVSNCDWTGTVHSYQVGWRNYEQIQAKDLYRGNKTDIFERPMHNSTKLPSKRSQGGTKSKSASPTTKDKRQKKEPIPYAVLINAWHR